MPPAIPKGPDRAHPLRAPIDLDNGIEHDFDESTGYELIHEGRRYPPTDFSVANETGGARISHGGTRQIIQLAGLESVKPLKKAGSNIPEGAS